MERKVEKKKRKEEREKGRKESRKHTGLQERRKERKNEKHRRTERNSKIDLYSATYPIKVGVYFFYHVCCNADVDSYIRDVILQTKRNIRYNY